MIDCCTQHNKKKDLNTQRGLSLIELTIVLLIMMALSGLILPSFTEVPTYAQCTATKASMKAIRDALLGNIDGVGYVADMGGFPGSLTELFVQPVSCSDPSLTDQTSCETAGETWIDTLFNPITGMGWRGAYLQGSSLLTTDDLSSGNFENPTPTALSHVSPYLAVGDLAILDSFTRGSSVRRPIIIQNPIANCTTEVIDTANADDCIRLVSAGRDGILQTAIDDADGSDRGDDLLLYLNIADPTLVVPENDQTGCVLTDMESTGAGGSPGGGGGTPGGGTVIPGGG